MYGPPSSVKVEPSSEVSSAYGMKKTGTRKISQVKPWAPWLATDADRVQADERADQEEEHVKAAKVLLQLRLFLDRC